MPKPSLAKLRISIMRGARRIGSTRLPVGTSGNRRKAIVSLLADGLIERASEQRYTVTDKGLLWLAGTQQPSPIKPWKGSG